MQSWVSSQPRPYRFLNALVVMPVFRVRAGDEMPWNGHADDVETTSSGLALLTDLYELTMVHGYLRAGLADTEAAFHVVFRSNPFEGGFAVACGLEPVLRYLTGLRFSEADLEYLATLRGSDGTRLLPDDVLAWLRHFEPALDVDIVPEGSLVFPNEPILRVCGSLPQAQLVETTLLNVINFQTLVATKAARVCLAAEGDPVIEFGLRRAQGADGGVSASRAAYVGGCAGTSNVLAGRMYGLPVMGTHAHSWVMAFPNERDAFSAYAQAMPGNCVFLVDTYDTIEGVRNAIEVGKWLRERGHELVGVRIDSGDLAWLSRQAREMLDEAGFGTAKVVASNELDEYLVASLKDQGARVDVWGVGTRLVTAHGDPALGGVYKLSAIREPGGKWSPRIKVSEQTAKVTTPGVLGVRRYARGGKFVGDAVYDTSNPGSLAITMVHPVDATKRKSFAETDEFEELLVPVMRGGEAVYDPPPLEESRRRTALQLGMLDDSHKRFLNPAEYHVGLEAGLYETRARLIMEARSRK